LQSFKANKNYLEQAQAQAPEFYQANIGMIRAMIEMAKLLGFNGPAQSGQESGQSSELGQQQSQMLDQAQAQQPEQKQPDPANPFPKHPENGGSSKDSSSPDDKKKPDPANPFPKHPDNGGAGKKPKDQ
jgi:hypothetical protein